MSDMTCPHCGKPIPSKARKQRRRMLSAAQLADIRERRNIGASVKSLAIDYGVSESMVSNICNRRGIYAT